MTTLPAPTRRMLGTTDIEVSSMAWGMWRSDGSVADLSRLLATALDAGIDLIDTADIYGFDGKSGFGDVENKLGEVLREDASLRQRMVLVTKGGIMPPVPYDQSREYMAGALEASLRRLGTNVIDLYLIHRPDILTHPQELARFLDDAVASGKLRSIGISNFTPAQIEALAHFLDTPLVATQPEISPLRIEPLDNGEMDQAMRLSLTPMAWSPLGGGRLMDPQTERERAVVQALDAVAAEAGVDRAVAAYGWLMAHPAGIVPIVGSQRPERIVEAAQTTQMRWTRQQWYSVFTAARGAPLP
ncbi:aldo/keto reductase [Paraurantiacibacter namhicola]|uniref:Oxidoreductase YdhF n=1 Tax=Paraurantiacibacter namhicola TaxID=645517 RepID=A0A1C7D717_9SPHN|nr:aldo/keto reductase [Paraurantiacibacter namhicola]ANU07237.1 Oxidoreductase YdhF [Paraurantiacibacter namhicola]